MAGSMTLDPNRLKRIDDWMVRNREGGRYTGSSLLVLQGGEEAYFGCDGLRSVENDLPYERDTIVRIYSMTKIVTSVVFGMLLEQGRVVLETPVSEFIPAFSDLRALIRGATQENQTESTQPPTLAQLLTHSSGLTYGFNPGLAGRIYEREKIDFNPRSGVLADMCDRAAAHPLAFQPGTKWEYSIGIDVIGRVIEVITGQPLDQVFRDRVFEPLGMKDTAFSVPSNKVARFADCYTKTPEDPRALMDPAEGSSFGEDKVTMFSGGGGLVSTLDDYARFGEMIRRGGELDGARLLSPSTLRFMRRNFLAGDIASMGAESFMEMPMAGMGFGIGGAVLLDPALARMPGSVGDFGWGGMASTYFWTDPVHDLTVVYFTQLVPSSSYPSRVELKALVHGAITS
ncbi:serine hydrolase domain-containing protein [Alisedimentitalea sp. MJ-SS2]|uniref:serine hydrolase domain-containing protein n=1 Tax=Aliisedimentitalea sp. MJ-SS2 TaxID=3049795 RepID=UPI0029145DAC|nr:serine hydrolase domain-containing protein [Alisedimentitalea sp. MJ-SS2]MDU8928704.1 serine hydrolase domain-containing protein [Alisedimentitalea sp. MJ-SS2]